MPRIATTLRALKHRNFRLYILGLSISMIGTWMQQVAIGWLVYKMTSSPVLLGLVAFVAQGPSFLLAPFAGELADRFDKLRIIIAAQLVMMIQAIVLGGLVLTGHVTIGWILVLSAVLGVASGFDIPARQSFLIVLVGDREDLPNAIALNSSIFNAARLVGPAIAGFAIAAIGEGPVIMLNGISYVFVLAALFALRIDPVPRPAQGAVLSRMREGFRYAWENRAIRSVLGLVAIISLLGVPFSVLLPMFANDVLHGGPRTLGVLMAATGFGALSGALFLASRSSVAGLGRVMVVCATLFGASLIGFAFATSLALALPLLTLAGFGMMAQMASSNTVLQTIVDDDKRGRVMAFYSMAFIGTAPIGSLFLGAVAGRYGPSAALTLGGASCIVGAVVFGRSLPMVREVVHPIYQRLGILPEVARGIQAATQQATPSAED